MNIENCGIGFKGLKGLAKGLIGSSSLEELRLEDSKIVNDGAVALSQTLENQVSLRVLTMSIINYLSDSLDSCSIQVEGIVALARALQKTSSLTYLNLNKDLYV